ncbi:hypothetical protein [Dactylosporangium sp. NPDC005555]|uniref:hypothetical protein n=1 Tax=Dactylosporangium sp. NPDC005555 TaxID=3154889 RepID=UPI0033AD271D
MTRRRRRFMATTGILGTPTIARPPAPHGVLDCDDDGYTLDGRLRAIFDYGPFTAGSNRSGRPAISLPHGHRPADRCATRCRPWPR